ncbi:uncharacterized protein [Palaemon carinicauda]|uniref:uncharacterized protein n=1 Tax=Palaemon carinicauda TaxID=392227 RepID=UPI0035B6266D
MEGHSSSGKIQSREGRVSNHHQGQKTHVQASDLKELFDASVTAITYLISSVSSMADTPTPFSRLCLITTMSLLLPDIDPEQEELYSATVAEREELIGDTSRQRYLTSDYQNYHEEVCETRRFYDGVCVSVGVKSSCKMRYSYVKMYIRLKYGYPPEEPKWEFVSVPSHCACELVPDNFIDGECLD